MQQVIGFFSAVLVGFFLATHSGPTALLHDVVPLNDVARCHATRMLCMYGSRTEFPEGRSLKTCLSIMLSASQQLLSLRSQRYCSERRGSVMEVAPLPGFTYFVGYGYADIKME